MEKRYAENLSKAKIDRICRIINREVFYKEGYLQQGLTAKRLAKRTGITVQDISAVTKVYFGSNFSSILQRLRVNRVCALLESPEYNRITCEILGLRSGFSSRQSLYNAFRKLRGITPEEYRKQKQNNNEKNTNADDSSDDVR